MKTTLLSIYLAAIAAATSPADTATTTLPATPAPRVEFRLAALATGSGEVRVFAVAGGQQIEVARLQHHKTYRAFFWRVETLPGVASGTVRYRLHGVTRVDGLNLGPVAEWEGDACDRVVIVGDPKK